MQRILSIIILSLALILPTTALAGKGNETIQSFNKAKRILQHQVYHDHRTTFYCGCPFDESKKLITSPHYTPKRINSRSERIEWEHVVPAYDFGRSFPEWREGHPECIDSKGKSFKGRNCARKMAIPFRYMEADLYNLVPAVGEINGLRSNYRFGMVPGEPREFGACDFEIEDRMAEPTEGVRGNIARTYKYMNWSYGRGIIGRARTKLFDAWDRSDPVDAWECERARRIEAIQGNENPFVREPCQAAGLWGEAYSPEPVPESAAIPGTTPAAIGGPYHGNARSHVFHGPGCRYYDCKNCTVVFSSKDEAIEAGYRAHRTCVE